jgi:hypothetical protein
VVPKVWLISTIAISLRLRKKIEAHPSPHYAAQVGGYGTNR